MRTLIALALTTLVAGSAWSCRTSEDLAVGGESNLTTITVNKPSFVNGDWQGIVRVDKVDSAGALISNAEGDVLATTKIDTGATTSQEVNVSVVRPAAADGNFFIRIRMAFFKEAGDSLDLLNTALSADDSRKALRFSGSTTLGTGANSSEVTPVISADYCTTPIEAIHEITSTTADTLSANLGICGTDGSPSENNVDVTINSEVLMQGTFQSQVQPSTAPATLPSVNLEDHRVTSTVVPSFILKKNGDAFSVKVLDFQLTSTGSDTATNLISQVLTTASGNLSIRISSGGEDSECSTSSSTVLGTQTGKVLFDAPVENKASVNGDFIALGNIALGTVETASYKLHSFFDASLTEPTFAGKLWVTIHHPMDNNGTWTFDAESPWLCAPLVGISIP